MCTLLVFAGAHRHRYSGSGLRSAPVQASTAAVASIERGIRAWSTAGASGHQASSTERAHEIGARGGTGRSTVSIFVCSFVRRRCSLCEVHFRSRYAETDACGTAESSTALCSLLSTQAPPIAARSNERRQSSS